MRILRRRSNLEVSSRGFALFVAGLVGASFLGGAVRTLLSSERVHRRIVRELKARFPKNQIDVGGVEVLLSRGIWPGFGLRVRDLTVAQDLCGKLSFTVRVPEATLPLSLSSLVRGRARLGEITIPSGQVDLDFKACPRPGEADPPAAPTLGATVRSRGIKPPRLDWSDVAETLDGVRVKDFEVNFRRAPRWKLKIQTGRVRFGRDLDLTAGLDLQRSLPFGTLSHPVNVGAVGRRGEITWLVSSELKEGRLGWSGRWDLAKNTADAKAELTQVPLKELSAELFTVGFLPRELKFRSAWLSGTLAWAGSLAEPFAAPIEVGHARVEGAYGRWSLERAAFFVDERAAFMAPAEVRVERAQLQGLAEAAGVRGFGGVVSRPGSFTGSLFVSGASDWTVLGRWEEVEFAFSNESVRGKQTLAKIDVRARREGAQVTATLDKPSLIEGAGDGTVELRYDLAKRAGGFDLKFSALELNPGVTTLLLGGRVSPLELTGAGVFSDGRLRRWDGEARAEVVSGQGWQIDGVGVRAEARDGAAVALDARAKRLNVDSRWRYFGDLSPAWPEGVRDFAWRDGHARVIVRGDGGQIQALNLPSLGGRDEWRIRGDWRRDGELFATLHAGPREKVFRLRGERGRLEVSPD